MGLTMNSFTRFESLTSTVRDIFETPVDKTTMKNQFSRKHYEAIASALANRIALEGAQSPAAGGIRLAALDLSYVFAADNPRFDRGRFLSAAGAIDTTFRPFRRPEPDNGQRTPRFSALQPSGSPFARSY